MKIVLYFHKKKNLMDNQFMWKLPKLYPNPIIIIHPKSTDINKVKIKRNGSDYKLTKQGLDDIETAYEFQTSDLN